MHSLVHYIFYSVEKNNNIQIKSKKIHFCIQIFKVKTVYCLQAVHTVSLDWNDEEADLTFPYHYLCSKYKQPLLLQLKLASSSYLNAFHGAFIHWSALSLDSHEAQQLNPNPEVFHVLIQPFK